MVLKDLELSLVYTEFLTVPKSLGGENKAYFIYFGTAGGERNLHEPLDRASATSHV